MTVRSPAGDLRPPIRVGARPAAASWYEVEGAGEPGRNDGQAGTLWMMIIDKGDMHGT
jgi:hypothetical protein